MVWQNGELLVGGRVKQQGQAACRAGIFEAGRQCDRAAGDLEIQTVLRRAFSALGRKEGFELNAQQTPLGQHPAALLDEIPEILLERRRRDDDRLAEKRAHLGPADIKNVAQTRQVGQSQPVLRRGQPVAETGAVQKKREPAGAAGRAQGLQLFPGIDRAVLGRVGNIDHAGLNQMLAVAVVPVRAEGIQYLGGGDFSIRGREREHLVACGFDGARLVDVNMSRGGAQHALMRAEQGGNDGGVGLRAAHEEVDGGVRCLTELPYGRGSGLAVGVVPVAGRLLQIRLAELFKNQGVASLRIIAFKMKHRSILRKKYSSARRRIAAGPRA